MKIFYSILAIVLSTTCLAQTTSGNTENGEGTYQYSNGATYKGEWKGGKRHGKGIMTYPEGASEANTVKQNNDSTCLCSNWTPQITSVNEEKIWNDIKSIGIGAFVSHSSIVGFYNDKAFMHLENTKFSPGKYYNLINIIDLVLAEKYKQAAEKTSEWALGTVFPAIAAYKGLIDASILTGNLIIENWMQDLYLMPIYQKVDQLVANEIRDGNANFDAYIFSGFVHKNPELRKKMQARERKMFNRWVEIYGNDMYVSISSKLRGENSFSRILTEMRKKYSPGTIITNEMIFNEFIWMAANDHKEEMLGVFKDEMEIRADENAEKLKRAMIKSICTSLTAKK